MRIRIQYFSSMRITDPDDQKLEKITVEKSIIISIKKLYTYT
jgi:hypothetical protein